MVICYLAIVTNTNAIAGGIGYDVIPFRCPVVLIAMLQFQQFTLRRGSQVLIAKASLQLHAGWKIGLTGVNGAGKSSLFAALLGHLSPDEGDLMRPMQWTIAHMAQEVEALDEVALDFVLAGDEEYWSIREQLAVNTDDCQLAQLHSRFDEIQGYAAPAKAAQLLAGLGFSTHQMQQTVKQFSGGWRMRLNLARTLMSRSDLLLLDEPTNHLDLDAILWLEQWLKNYQGTLVMIAHDRDFLDAVVDHILHIEQSTLTLYTGNYSTFEITRSERLAQQQQAFEKQQQTRAHLQRFIDRFKAQATKARQAQSRIKQLERMQHVSAAHIDTPFTFSFREPTRMNNPLLALKEATIGYGESTILEHVNLTMTSTTRLGLLGMNGAGKSTLIKALVGDLPLSKGVRQASELLNIGYFAQHQMDALDNTASPMMQLTRLAGQDTADAVLRAFLGSFGFSGERMDTPCQQFSGGERARLALALIVWQRPNLLILDEPTNHLDLDMRHALTMALQEFAGAVVLVSHERQLIDSVCDELLLVHSKRCQPFDGDLHDYATWLMQARQQILQQNSSFTPKAVAKTDKEQQRKIAAQRRQQTQPLRQLLAQLEGQEQQVQQQLQQLEQRLTDTTLYEPEQKSVLLELMQQQKHCLQQHHALEERILDTMLELETLEQKLTEN